MITQTQSVSTFEVKSTSPYKQYKKVNLLDYNGKTTQIKVHRFAQIGKGDKVYIDPKRTGHVSVVSSENDSDRIQVIQILCIHNHSHFLCRDST